MILCLMKSISFVALKKKKMNCFKKKKKKKLLCGSKIPSLMKGNFI